MHPKGNLIISPGYCWAEEEKRTQRPVSKLADLQVTLDRQRSIQSVNISVPGLESRISSGAVNTLPEINKIRYQCVRMW